MQISPKARADCLALSWRNRDGRDVMPAPLPHGLAAAEQHSAATYKGVRCTEFISSELAIAWRGKLIASCQRASSPTKSHKCLLWMCQVEWSLVRLM